MHLAIMHSTLLKLVNCHECSLGQSLVVAADFYLLAIFKYLLQRIGSCSKLLKLLVQLLLDICRNLIGALSDDGYALVDITSFFTEVHDVACHRIGGCFSLLVIHICIVS